MRIQSRALGTVAVLSLSLSASQAHAAGFEKSIFWDGHYAAIAGAAQSSVTGPQALYWNPAALAGTEGLQINGDVSPTWAMYSGPFAAGTGSAINSNTTFSPVGAAFVSAGLTPQWGVGIGYYVSAGTKADYDSVNLAGAAALLGLGSSYYEPPFKSDLTVTELSIGTGYELLPGLKLGAGYRMVFVNATLDTAFVSAPALVGVQINNISQTRSGFRVGLDWAPKDSSFGFGVEYRNQVRFNANGTANVTTASSGAPTGVAAGSGENVIVSGVLPQRVDAAAHYVFNTAFTGFLGYSFTNYSQEKSLGVSGVVVGAAPATNADIPLNWTNMHNLRIGGQYNGLENWPIRGGFVWTSEVTPKGNALATIPSPGVGYTLIAGTGHNLMSNLTLDGAFEYSWDSGSVAAADNPASTTAVGDYTAKAYALHLSATYTF